MNLSYAVVVVNFYQDRFIEIYVILKMSMPNNIQENRSKGYNWQITGVL
jgi:hypothetical protein